MICFTSDIDWAPEEVIEDFISLFEEYNVKCTLFATHDSKILKTLNPKLFEIGIHPNFNQILFSKENRNDINDILQNLMLIYPESIGVRNHSLTYNTGLLEIYRNLGLQYESNTLIPYNINLKPYKCWSGLTRIPYNWEDDVHFLYNKSFTLNFLDNYQEEKFYILDYHPIHVYLNTDSEKTYNNARPYYQQVSQLKCLRNNSIDGARDNLIMHLKFIKENSIPTFQLKDLVV